MTTPALIVESVSKTFRIPHVEFTSLRGRILHPFAKTTVEEFDALDDVSFQVEEGEFFGIVGRNGSGKSTLLKVIAGIYKPDGGKVTVNGSLAPFIELGVGFNPELSGRDNVFINGALLGLTTQRIRDRYEDIVEFAELHRFMDLKLRNFSSGMQVRLAFAIALEAGADILLTDEVLAVGDENFQRKCFDVFRQRKDDGKTALFVTHDMTAVLEFCDRTMMLEHGRITAIGDTREVVRRYHQLNVHNQPDKAAAPILADTVASPAVIAEVEVLQDGVAVADTVAHGTQLGIRVHTKLLEAMTDPIIGIVIKDRLGKSIVITNNWWERDDAGLCPAGSTLVTTFSIDNILSAGDYLVQAEVAEAGPGEVRHTLRDAAHFTVTADLETYGVFDPAVTVTNELA
ncbi:MAG: ABC transporter ATP-binding protein [Thermoleophilia bacterium]|nr:ABC transporter ATP-binding protein [Thermoleophilia bacterium]